MAYTESRFPNSRADHLANWDLALLIYEDKV